MQHLYFAYGSNLSLARMRGRISCAAVIAAARLDDHRLTLDKRGRDGSGKANLRPEPGAFVWGVVYDLAPAGFEALDAVEAGYQRVSAAVTTAAGLRLEAATYRSQLLTPEPLPFPWYKRLLVDGAREHGLPGDWVAWLEALPCLAEPGGGSREP